MLAPVAEAEFGHSARKLLGLGLRSAEMWPEFAAELEQVCDLEIGLRQTGTLLIARDQDEARELERQIELRESLSLQTVRLLPSQARELEPALAPTLRLALEIPGDHSVDPRLLLAALSRACERCGVCVREGTPVRTLEVDRDRQRLAGVRLENGERLLAAEVLVAAGAWSATLEGLAPEAGVPVRPVKGQILRLHDPDGPGLLGRVVRFQGGYLVPRADGGYVLGASVEERGFESAATAGVVYELLRQARELLPGIAELQLREIGVGLRPSTPDNAPVIGRGALEGLLWATGHHRNGILLSPLSARLIVALLTGTASSDDLELLSACAPTRFAPTDPATKALRAAAVGAGS
jgi:glycine oxidase